MCSEKSSDDSQEPFEVWPEGGSGTAPLRFDPSEWAFSASKQRTEGQCDFEEIPNFFIDESIYQGKPNQWVVISERTHREAENYLERTYRVLLNEEAADWFVDCQAEVPEALAEFMTSRSLTPDSLETIKPERPVPPEEPIELVISPGDFIEYWEQFDLLWNRIFRYAEDLESSAEAMQLLRENVKVLIQSVDRYGRSKYYVPARRPNGDLDMVAEPVLVDFLEKVDGELYVHANGVYREMIPAVKEMAIAITESRDLNQIACNCQRIADPFCHSVSLVHESINESGDAELADVRFARATKRLSQIASNNASSEGAHKPKWDGKKLLVGNALVTEFRRDAKNQAAILEAFQLGEWAERIDDPLPHPSDPQRLRETVANLNKRQDKIVFEGDGTGAGVLWSMRGRSADDKSS